MQIVLSLHENANGNIKREAAQDSAIFQTGMG